MEGLFPIKRARSLSVKRGVDQRKRSEKERVDGLQGTEQSVLTAGGQKFTRGASRQGATG